MDTCNANSTEQITIPKLRAKFFALEKYEAESPPCPICLGAKMITVLETEVELKCSCRDGKAQHNDRLYLWRVLGPAEVKEVEFHIWGTSKEFTVVLDFGRNKTRRYKIEECFPTTEPAELAAAKLNAEAYTAYKAELVTRGQD